MKRIVLIILAVIGCIMLAGAADDAAQARRQAKQQFMRDKLTCSQGIVEGLVLERYDLIKTNAAIIRNMNLTNAFLALKNSLYLQDIANFQAKVDALTNAVAEKDLDKATAAYSEMVNSCVACHKQFRRAQVTAAK
jgi:cytochrome c556